MGNINSDSAICFHVFVPNVNTGLVAHCFKIAGVVNKGLVAHCFKIAGVVNTGLVAPCFVNTGLVAHYFKIDCDTCLAAQGFQRVLN